jgi:hypothetical protein
MSAIIQIFVFFFTPIWTGVYSTVRSGLTLGSDLVLTILANLGWYFWISLHYSSVPSVSTPCKILSRVSSCELIGGVKFSGE